MATVAGTRIEAQRFREGAGMSTLRQQIVLSGHRGRGDRRADASPRN
jgi:hypothetical protein